MGLEQGTEGGALGVAILTHGGDWNLSRRAHLHARRDRDGLGERAATARVQR
jgi:hypothetical protein